MKILRLLSLFLLLSSFSCNDNSNNPVPDVLPPIVEPPEVVVPPVGPVLADEDLLNLVQKESLKYFWEYAQVNSKLARERYHVEDPGNDQNIVTTGGSGFGLMTLLVGVERGFINREEAVTRLQTALTFLEKADRFHGAWSHWIDGTNGKVIPFGNNGDDGGDLVETSFLCQGLICVREYFKNGTAAEKELAAKADVLWKGVDWNWYTKGGEEVLYWHWSPNFGWKMNFKLEGYNECLITYVMAAASPTHPIPAVAYTKGWTRNGAMATSGTTYGIPKIFNYNGTNSVGPMFWSHYSYLGLDPRGLTDQFGDYWALTQNHAKIMLQYAVENPKKFKDYGANCWGLTASYTRNANGSVGYTAHQPNNDTGVITPTAAISNFPYTPVESMKALRFFYENWHQKLIGVAGPYDAFSPQYNWVTKRYLAIDQGTIVPMIENHRTGMLWNLFMNAPEVKTGLKNLGFSSTQHAL